MIFCRKDLNPRSLLVFHVPARVDWRLWKGTCTMTIQEPVHSLVIVHWDVDYLEMRETLAVKLDC